MRYFMCCAPECRGGICRHAMAPTQRLIIVSTVGRRGIWKRVFDQLASKSHGGLYLIDSTIVKAHRAASGGKGGRKIRRSVSVGAAEPRKSTPLSIARAGR